MKQLLTTKQVATALGVSESSLKRWCDRGIIPMERTAGGHRRIPLEGIVAFLRESGHTAPHPELLGLPAISGTGERVLNRACRELESSLLSNREECARQLLFSLLLHGHSLVEILDEVVAGAFRGIGEQWACGEVEVFEERRACQMVSRLMAELRRAIPAPAWDAPVAIGGTPPHDPYQLGTAAVELALRDLGWNAQSLGNHLPFDTTVTAIRRGQPRLCWLSVSYVEDAAAFEAGLVTLSAATREVGAQLVIGGRAAPSEVLQRFPELPACRQLSELREVANRLWERPAASPQRLESAG